MLSTNINKAFKYSQNSQILTKFSIKSAKTLKLLKLECINDPKVFSRIFWEETEAEEEEERSVLFINIFARVLSRVDICRFPGCVMFSENNAILLALPELL